MVRLRKRRAVVTALAVIAFTVAQATGSSPLASEGEAVAVAVDGAADPAVCEAYVAVQGTTGPAVAPVSGEHPVFHLRPEPFSEESAAALVLDELLDITMANNIGLRLQGYTIEKGHYSVDQTYYAFDPSLSASLGYGKQTAGGIPATTGSGVSGSESYTGSFSYTVPREYGDAFQLSYNLSRGSYDMAGSSGVPVPTAYGSGFSVGYSRPLMRGAGKYVNRIPRYMASNNLVLSYDKLDDELRSLRKSVLDVYFQAVSARRGIDVREAGLERALKQLEYSVERYKAGLAIQAEVLQAENSVLSQRSQLLQARNSYSDLLDQLTVLSGLPQEFALAVDADDALIELGAAFPGDLWEMVRANSYDLKSLNTQLANLRLSRDQLCDRLKPEMGLALSYGRTGDDDTLARAATGYENESYQVSLSYRKTPGERSTRAGLAQAEIDLASVELSIQQAELQLMAALRSYERDLATKHQQIELAEGARGVVDETYNITVERRNVGLATTLDVIEAQEDLLGAELSLLTARVAYRQAYREIQLMAGLI